jgi:hypothetical protein
MEYDLSFGQPDTLIGAATVTVHNKNNKIETHWSIPKANYSAPTTMIKKNKNYEFSMSDNKGNYKMILKLDFPVKH